MNLLWIYLAGAFIWGVALSLAAIHTDDFVYKMGKEQVIFQMLQPYHGINYHGVTRERFDTYKTKGSGAFLNIVLWPIVLPWFIIFALLMILFGAYEQLLDKHRKQKMRGGRPDTDGDCNSPNES